MANILQALFFIVAVINVATTYLLTFYFPAQVEAKALKLGTPTVIADSVLEPQVKAELKAAITKLR